MKVGGNVLNALTIEHLILRLPYHLKYVSSLLELHGMLKMEALKFVAEIFVPLRNPTANLSSNAYHRRAQN